MTRLLLFISLLSINAFAKEYNLQWYVKSETTENLEYDESTSYGTTNAKGPWEDSLGNFGSLDCAGIFGLDNNKDVVNVNCIGIDNNNNKFSVNMRRVSEQNIGLGKVTYLKGTGKYNLMIGKVCNYAVNYSNGYGFYKQKCKLDDKAFEGLNENNKVD